MQKDKLTASDITEDDFRSYEKVRKCGRWNMFDPAARRATGLERDTYIGIIQNYEELCATYPHIRDLSK